MKTRLLVALAAVALLFAAAMTKAVASGDGRPIHEIRGQGIVQLSPPDGGVYTISINAWQDQNGVVHGVATWLNEFPLGPIPKWSGWQWVIDVDTLIMHSANTASVGGVIVHDNKFPWNEGDRTVILGVVDNGQGAVDPADEIFFSVPILGGNFIVR